MVTSIGGSSTVHHPLRQLLAKSDSNADGKLDSTEIQSLLDKLQGNDTGSTSGNLTADKIISAFDTNGDGAVSGTEFKAKFQQLSQSLQSNLISAQESAQAGGPPAVQGGHHHHHGGRKDGDGDDDQSLLNLLDGSNDNSADGGTSSTQTADASGTDLVRTFLTQLRQYSQTQNAFGLTAAAGSSVSASA